MEAFPRLLSSPDSAENPLCIHNALFWSSLHFNLVWDKFNTGWQFHYFGGSHCRLCHLRLLFYGISVCGGRMGPYPTHGKVWTHPCWVEGTPFLRGRAFVNSETPWQMVLPLLPAIWNHTVAPPTAMVLGFMTLFQMRQTFSICVRKPLHIFVFRFSLNLRRKFHW